MSLQAAAFALMVAWRCRSDGRSVLLTASVAAMWIALGKASFDDWERLTSSFW
jgi:hypothetical protein